MIFFATSRAGFDALVASSGWPVEALWVAAGVLSDDEVASLRASGLELSCFTEAADYAKWGVLGSAIDTIKEHHPDRVVWADAP